MFGSKVNIGGAILTAGMLLEHIGFPEGARHVEQALVQFPLARHGAIARAEHARICGNHVEALTWLAAMQAVTSRCGGQPGKLAVIGLEAFTALVRDALSGWGGQRIHGPIGKAVFAALTSTVVPKSLFSDWMREATLTVSPTSAKQLHELVDCYTKTRFMCFENSEGTLFDEPTEEQKTRRARRLSEAEETAAPPTH